MVKNIVYLDGQSLSIEDVINVAGKGYKVAFDPKKKINGMTIDQKLKNDRAKLEKQLHEHPEIKIYGTNKLHGDLKYVDVDNEKLLLYQEKYIKSHNCGTGKAMPVEYVRAMMVIRLNSFAKCQSAMRYETCKLMIDMLNNFVTPWVLEEGSVGASGDLVPLSMIAAVLIGLPEAKAFVTDENYYKKSDVEKEKFILSPISAKAALKKRGLEPIKLGPKEAMGLTNGTNLITAFAVFALRDAENLLANASLSAAMSLEAIRGETDAFADIIYKNRPHPGQIKIAKEMKSLLKGSKRCSRTAQMDIFINRDNDPLDYDDKIKELKQKLCEAIDQITAKKFKETVKTCKNKILLFIDKRDFEKAHDVVAHELKRDVRDNFLSKVISRKEYERINRKIRRLLAVFPFDERVQDRYSYRAVPQVHGATFEAVQKFRQSLEIEINSVTDNPLFEFTKDGIKAYSGANFHGQPMAVMVDYLKIALTSMGLCTDKRVFSLLSNHLNYGLPADLAYDSANADGGLMIAQYAGAARAAESRILSNPASVMSISTAANQEDFVSMGSLGVVHLKKVIENIQKIVGIELLCTVRAIQLTYNNLPKNLRPLGNGTSKIYENVAELLGDVGEDKYLRTDMERIIDLVKSGELVSKLSGIY